MSNSSNEHLLAPQYFKGLKQMNADVEGTYYLDTLEKKINTSKKSKILFHLRPSGFYKACNRQLLNDVDRYHPDIVWIFKGMEIFPSTLNRIKEKGIKLVNYNLDHPFRFVSKGSGNQNVRNSIPAYDLHISYSQRIIQELQERYPGIRTFHLPFGYHSYVDDLQPDGVEINKVCFVGYGDEERAEAIHFLGNQGIDIDLYGDRWKKFIPKKMSNVRIYPPVYGLEYWSILSRYRVQLNLFRPHNLGSHNMRTFEIPAIGGIMLSRHSDEQLQYFEPEKEAFFYYDLDGLLKQVQKLLSLDRADAKKIREQARKRCLEKGYSYNERSKTIYEEFRRIFHE